MSGNWGIEVFLAMSKEQAKRQNCYRCMRSELMNSDILYDMLDEIPEALCISKEIGWQKEICMTKANFLELAKKWGICLMSPELDFINHVDGDHIWLMGFGG